MLQRALKPRLAVLELAQGAITRGQTRGYGHFANRHPAFAVALERLNPLPSILVNLQRRVVFAANGEQDLFDVVRLVDIPRRCIAVLGSHARQVGERTSDIQHAELEVEPRELVERRHAHVGLFRNDLVSACGTGLQHVADRNGIECSAVDCNGSKHLFEEPNAGGRFLLRAFRRFCFLFRQLCLRACFVASRRESQRVPGGCGRKCH